MCLFRLAKEFCKGNNLTISVGGSYQNVSESPAFNVVWGRCSAMYDGGNDECANPVPDVYMWAMKGMGYSVPVVVGCDTANPNDVNFNFGLTCEQLFVGTVRGIPYYRAARLEQDMMNGMSTMLPKPDCITPPPQW